MKGKFLVKTLRGKKFFELQEGKIICERDGKELLRRGKYSGQLRDGVHVVEISEFGYDRCDRIV